MTGRLTGCDQASEVGEGVERPRLENEVCYRTVVTHMFVSHLKMISPKINKKNPNLHCTQLFTVCFFDEWPQTKKSKLNFDTYFL